MALSLEDLTGMEETLQKMFQKAKDRQEYYFRMNDPEHERDVVNAAAVLLEVSKQIQQFGQKR